MDFQELAILLAVAAVFGIVAKLFKQPLLIGYLLAGFLLRASGLIEDNEAFTSLGQVGVALLLFLVGLEMNISELPTIGKAAILTGIGQILFTSVIGFLLSSVLGFGLLPSLYIAVALTFSSTIIIIKLLSEKNDLDSLYGRISIGFLLVQDFVAVLILMFLASIGRGEMGVDAYFFIGIKAAAILGVLWLLSKEVLPRFFSTFIDNSTELIFIVSIGWALGVAALVGGPLGFSIEIGGFLAGLSLSTLPDHLQVASRTKPLRDFFLTIFFLVLGTSIVIGDLGIILIPALILSIFVLVGNPIIVMVIMGLLGYKKRTSFLASVTVAQISEFSLILMAMGLSLGHVSSQNVSMIVVVGVITMAASTYLILGTEKLYPRLASILSLFEKKVTSEFEIKPAREHRGHVVLIGSDRTGSAVRRYLKRTKVDFVVVDYNPEVVSKLAKAGIDVLFGDIIDEDVFEASGISMSALVISTTADKYDNLTILERIRKMKHKPMTILKAVSLSEALILYKKGASYVIVPEIVAGDHIRHILKTYGVSERIIKMGKGHMQRLYL